MGLQDEDVHDLEAMEIRQLDVDELVRYCTGLGMPVTITVDVHSLPRVESSRVEIFSTRKRRT
jgi:predicted RNase H-like nuclease (RuvC/YqgF family)